MAGPTKLAPNRANYDSDFYAWSQQQAALLRARAFDGVDIANVAQEIESLGRRDRLEIGNRLTVLLTHLLKWQSQPAQQSSGWLGTIVEQRRGIGRLLEESPRLVGWVPGVVGRAYGDAREDAARETGVPEETFPPACPYTPSDILDKNWLPEAFEQKLEPRGCSS